MSEMTGEKVDRDGGHGHGNGGTLPSSDDAGCVEKSTPDNHTLSIDHLDRTNGYTDNHYSWREAAKACHASQGCSHE
jgi:hypothetical protein